MVKPPRTMEPEAVDLSKAGRKSGRAFQADSFHQYMARKIDLQRSQFGLVLPPAPAPAPPPAKSTTSVTVKTPSPSFSRKRPRTSPSSANDNNHNKSVTFAALPLQCQATEEEKEKEDVATTPHSMSAILRNLKKRHGKGCKRVLSRHHGKRKRHKHSTDQSELHLNTGGDERTEETKFGAEAKQAVASRKEEHQEEESSLQQQPLSSSSVPATLFPDSTTTTSSEDSETPPSYLKLRRVRPDLFFLGIVVKVNGYTNPDNETLKRLLQRHGGDLETYETTRVTHIVAEHLSTAKANYLKQQRRPRPVVLPMWITDSVAAGKLLPHGDYLLEELQDPRTQVGIKDWFGSIATRKTKAPLSEKDAALAINECVKQDGESQSLPAFHPLPPAASQTTCSKLHDESASSSPMEMDDSSAQTDDDNDQREVFPLTQPTQEDDSTGDHDDGLQMSQSDIPSGPAVASIECPPVANNETYAKDNNNYLQEQPDSTIMGESASTETPTGDDLPKVKKSSSPEKHPGKTDGKYINGRIRTVGTDPKFLDSFFANSRLSFIGSYKQRTEKEGKPHPNLERDRSTRSKRFVFHIDMDCFFANVVLRNYPQYRDKPVAISHHGKKRGEREVPVASENSTSECATCNYPARKFGIKKGMYLGRARQLCPDLIVLHYDFAGYEEVSEQVLSILHRVAAEHAGCVEAVSCDEAYMELHLPYRGEDTMTPSNLAGEIAESIRKEIFETTQCTASIGVAANKFLAKIGTDRVKPNGNFVVNDHRLVLEKLRLRDLHGIGYRSEPKLLSEGLDTVQDVWDLGSKAESVLGRVLGPALGKKIYDFCHGHDDRQVKPAERKTIGAECNYGVRFDGPYGIDNFMNGLAAEVEKRMEAVGCKGGKLTLKVKQRKQNAKPPPKFLGHGSCHNLSRSMDVPGLTPTREAKILVEVGMTLFRELAVPLDDVRGMGIVVSKLSTDAEMESTAAAKACSTTGISLFFQTSSKQNNSTASVQAGSDKEEPGKETHDGESREGRSNQIPELSSEGGAAESFHDGDDCDIDDLSNAGSVVPGDDDHGGSLALPPFSQICMSQVAALPPEMQEEIRSHMVRNKKQSSRPREESSVPIDLESPPRKEKSGAKESQLPRSVFAQERQHFRQTSLRRMMKLAAAKSGQGLVSGMPVADFLRLPLELQLQIANEDSGPLGVLSQKRRSSGSSRQFSKNRATLQEPRSKSNGSVTKKPASERVREVDLAVDQQELKVAASLPQATSDQVEEDAGPARPTDLFDDDISPLQNFLDENSPLNSDAVDMVSDFLRTCLAERRLNAIVPMIRSIKKRKDQWSEQGVLSAIVQCLDDDHEKLYRCRLDVDWLLRD